MVQGNNPLGVNQWTGKAKTPAEIIKEARERQRELARLAVLQRSNVANLKTSVNELKKEPTKGNVDKVKADTFKTEATTRVKRNLVVKQKKSALELKAMAAQQKATAAQMRASARMNRATKLMDARNWKKIQKNGGGSMVTGGAMIGASAYENAKMNFNAAKSTTLELFGKKKKKK